MNVWSCQISIVCNKEARLVVCTTWCIYRLDEIDKKNTDDYELLVKKNNKMNFLPEQTGGSPIHCCPILHTRVRLPEVNSYPLSHV